MIIPTEFASVFASLTMMNNTKPYLFLSLKWLLLVLLIGILGQFMEGPPTRVVVRSSGFVFCCFAMSLFAAHFLHKVKKIHITVITTLGLLVPGGYIYMAQCFYTGGKNMDFALPLLFFTLLMALNCLFFIRALFSLRKTKSNGVRPRISDSQGT